MLAFLDREATSAEDFHAGLNFAGVFRVPAVFVCINDAPAGAAPVETVSETLAVKALAYGIAGMRVDGQRSVRGLRGDARRRRPRAQGRRARRLIEAVVAETGDPLERVRTWLASQNMLDAAAEATLRREVEAELAALA